jgi:hypothetical protein
MVQLVHAECDGPWELPVLGAVTAPDAVLIRPDGYVAWVGTARMPGLEWAWAMVECIVSGATWDDVGDAQHEGRAARLAPAIERLELLETLAERAPDDDAVGFLGADALQDYLGSNPDVAGVERAAQRSERFRLALASTGRRRGASAPPRPVPDRY